MASIGIAGRSARRAGPLHATRLAAAASLALALGPHAGAEPGAEPGAGPAAAWGAGHELVRGMTLSCQTWGREWGSAALGAELDELAALGVNWIAIHPYAGVRADGRLSWRPIDPEAPPRWLRHPIEEARRRDMAILIKPHLAYWGSGFRWRGEIDFPDPGARARFFEQYEAWIRDVARATRGADAFAVGTELERLAGDEASWRRIVAAAREETDALLTYAANWDSFDRVPFWDALDAIGVQAYFPLAARPEPDPGELRRGWQRVLPLLRAASERAGKPVVFTEIGYDLSLDAARVPWDPPPPAPEERERARAVQTRCLETALAVLGEEREWLRGAFLWKWFVGEAPGTDFLVDTPHLRSVLELHWLRAR